MGRPQFSSSFRWVMSLFFIVSTHFFSNPAYAATEIKPERARILEQIRASYQFPILYELKTLKRTSRVNNRCHIYKYKFLVDDKDNTGAPLEVFGVMYAPNPKRRKEAQSVPLVLQLPPISGVNMLDRMLAGDLCRNGMASIIIANDFTGLEKEDLPPVEDHILAYRRMVSATKGAIELAKGFSNIDSQHVGLFGVSLGGILSAMAFSVIDQFSGGYFIVSGTDAPRILAISEETTVKRLRRKRMLQEGLETAEDYEDYLRSAMDHDTSDFAHRVPPESVHLVVSENDTKVPSYNQLNMVEKFGDPQTIFEKKGHSSVVIKRLLWASNRRSVIDFFKDRLFIEK